LRKRILRFWLVWLSSLLMCHTFGAAAYAETPSAYVLSIGKVANGQVTVTLSGKNVVDFYGFEAAFSFDPDRLELLEFMSVRDGYAISPIINNGKIVIAHTKIGNTAGDRGDIVIGTLKFKVKKYGETTVTWESIKVVPSQGKSATSAVGQRVAISFGKAFADLAGHWAQTDIEWLAMKGLIEGVDDTHFQPEANVTRAQFAVMIARALNLQAPASAPRQPFADVPQDAWYAEAVRSAYAAGIINGVAKNRFAPNKEMTREEMMVMLIRAGKLVAADAFNNPDPTVALTFADTQSISKWAISDVTLAVHAGLIKGNSQHKLIPQSKATRAEAAVIIKRLLSIM